VKYSKEVKTALLAIIAVILLIFGYSFLKGKNLLESSKTFYAVYADVEGLSVSSPVTINGLKVGSVTEIDFLNTSGLLLVTFTIDKEFPFSKNSIAQLYGGGLIGGKSVAILPEYEPGAIAESGDTLPSNIEEGLLELVNNRLTPLQEKVEQAVESADSLINSLNKVLNPDTRHNIKTSFEDLSITIASLKSSAQTINGVLDENSGKLDRTFTNLDEMSANLNSFSDTLATVNLNDIIRDMEKVVADLESTTDKINNGDGTLGKMMNDPSIYNNLDRATKQLEELLQDIKLNPKRYVHFSVFGKRPGPYNPPQDSLN